MKHGKRRARSPPVHEEGKKQDAKEQRSVFKALQPQRRKRLLCVRHGESVANVGEWEAVDAFLTTRGHQQAARAGERLRLMELEPAPSTVFVSSPLSRALTTALQLQRSAGFDHSELIVSSGCREKPNVPSDLGRSPESLQHDFTSLSSQLNSLPDNWCRQSEAASDFKRRVSSMRTYLTTLEAHTIVLIVRPIFHLHLLMHCSFVLYKQQVRSYHLQGHYTFLAHLTDRHMSNGEIHELEI